MQQPNDYVEGYDPYSTNPGYRQQLSEDEVIQPLRAKPQKRKGRKEKKHNRSDTEAFEDWPEGPACQPTQKPLSHEENSMPRFLDFLIPPVHDTPENVRRHRIALSAAVMILFLHMGLACGLFQKFGFQGFASASSVNKITVKLLERDIFETRTSQCKATTDDSRQFYGKKLVELLREYQEETKQAYPLPTCKELGSGEP